MELESQHSSVWSWMIRLYGEPIALQRGTALHAVDTDHLGRPQIVTSASRNLMWRASNYAFDRTVATTSVLGVNGLNLGFPGQLYDSETGLWHNGFRDYDALTGRYLQSDPIGLSGGINTYTYAANNPLTKIDPLGLDVTVCLYPGAVGFGHVGIGVNNNSTWGFYPAEGGPENLITGTPGEVIPDDKDPYSCKNIETTAEQDKAMSSYISSSIAVPYGNYSFTGNNCVNYVREVLRQAGISSPESISPRPFFSGLDGRVIGE